MNASDRDRSIEHLLRRMPASAASTSDCMDAGRMAAWAEGALRPDEAARVETHLADCARCQAVLAVFADAAPAAPAAVPFWHRWKVQWLAPIAAAAAAVVLWAVVPWTGREEAPTTTVAIAPPEPVVAPRVNPPAAPVPAGDMGAEQSPVDSSPLESIEAPLDSAAREVARPVTESAEREAVRPFRPSPAPPAAAPMAPPPPRPEASSNATFAASAPSPPPPPAPMAAPPASPAPVSAPSAEPQRPAGVAVIPGPAAGMTVAPASSSPPEQRRVQASSTFAIGAAGVGGGATNVVLPSPLPMHVRVVTGRLVVFAPPLPRAVETEAVADTAARVASPAVWWRIDAGGRIWRSNDSGVAWRPMPLDPAIGIVAASAPTGTVCWVLARGGVVLRSADGVSFQVATTPAGAASPVAIEALSATAAVVIAGDGRRWSTVDGGMTWAPVP